MLRSHCVGLAIGVASWLAAAISPMPARADVANAALGEPQPLSEATPLGHARLTFLNGRTAEAELLRIEPEWIIFRELAGSELRISRSSVHCVQSLSPGGSLIREAEVRFAKGENLAAYKNLAEAVRLDPRLDRWPEVEELRQVVEGELAAQRTRDLQELDAEIKSLLDRQNFRTAYDRVDRALAIYPEDVEVLARGVELEFEQNRYDSYYPLAFKSRYADRLKEFKPDAPILKSLDQLARSRANRALEDERDKFALEQRILADIRESRANRRRGIYREGRPSLSSAPRAQVQVLPSTVAEAERLRARVQARNARRAINATVFDCPYD